MAKKPEPQPEEKAKRYSVTIDNDLTKKLRFLAADANVTVPDYVNNQLRKIIEREWPRIQAELAE